MVRSPKKDQYGHIRPISHKSPIRDELLTSPDRARQDKVNCQQPTANRSGYLDRQNLPATIVPTGWACSVATDPATALRTLGQLRGVPAVGGFSRPKSHLGRFSFRYTHLLSLLS